MFGIHECELTFSKVSPILTVISAMLSTAGLIEKGFEPHFMSLIIPCFISMYLPGLIANCTTQRFIVDYRCALLQMVGVALSLFLHNQRTLLRLIGDLPLASKMFNYLSYSHEKGSTKALLTWLVINELMSIFIRKSLLRKKMRIRSGEAVNSFLCILVLGLVRYYGLPTKYVALAIFTVPVLKRIQKVVLVLRSSKKDSSTKAMTTKKEPVANPKTRRGKKKAD